MLARPMDVLTAFPVRKSKAQKQAFRDAVQSYVIGLGYVCKVERGSFGSRNIVIGDPENAKYVVTAHYDTPANMIVPNLITPCNFLTFLLYQVTVVGVIMAATILFAIVVNTLVQDAMLTERIALIFYFGVVVVMMAGPANKSNANDNTSGVITVLETARTMPEMHRDQVAFVLFDLEELGTIGSAAYRKKHKKATNGQTILNLDCVGDGDHILLLPFKKALKDPQLLAGLNRVSGRFGSKQIEVRTKGCRFYPSDQMNFPKCVGIAAFHKRKWVGYYCARIHTRKDTVLEETNINVLRAAITSLITCDAAQ